MKENDIALDGKRLLMEIRNVPYEIGVYPQAVLGGDYPYEKRTDFMQGWNACVCNYGHEISKAIYRSLTPFAEPEEVFAIGNEFTFLRMDGKWYVFLNDTWYYATSDSEEMPEEEWPKIVDLYKSYGNAGVMYWVYLRRGHLPQIASTRRKVLAIEALIIEEKREREERDKRREVAR